MTGEGCHHANSAETVRPGSESTSLMASIAALASIKLSQGVCVCVGVCVHVCGCVCACPERAATKCCSNTHVAFLNAEVKFKNTLLLCIMIINCLTVRLKEKRQFNKRFLQRPLRDCSRMGG